jgi:hypothetical protein
MATNITGDSPQAVALDLLEKIALAESWAGPPETRKTGGGWLKSRAEILNTYAECLKAVSIQRETTHFP